MWCSNSRQSLEERRGSEREKGRREKERERGKGRQMERHRQKEREKEKRGVVRIGGEVFPCSLNPHHHLP